MEEEIVNRISKSPLKIFDLEDFYPKGDIVCIDFENFLYQGLVLKERDFRDMIKQKDWSEVKGKLVYIQCSCDAVIPLWAYMLLASSMFNFAEKVVVGDKEKLLEAHYAEVFQNLDFAPYKDKPVIIKGCSKHTIPVGVYIMAMQKLQPLAKVISFGEACSIVPLFRA